MISSKTIDLLKTFSEDEFREFGLFLDSPFHNKDKILIALYNSVKNFHPNFDSNRLTKEKIFAKLYPKKKYNDARIRNLLSDLLKCAQDFLSIYSFKNDPLKMNLNLAEEFLMRSRFKELEKAHNAIDELMEKETIRDEKYFERKYLAGKLGFNYRNVLRKKEGSIDELKLDLYESLRIFFLIGAASLETEISNSERDRFSYGSNPNQRKELERYLDMEAQEHEDIIYVRYYYNMYKLGRTQDKKYFHELRDIIKNHYQSLNETDKRNIFTALTNYCYYAANKGDTDLYRDHFELHRENMQKGSYKMGQYMTHVTFFNTVVTGLEVAEFDWVDRFIEEYIGELEESEQKNAYAFCRALFFYHTKEFEKALETAAGVVSDQMTYKHQLKSLYLKIYYDMNESEPFYSNIDGYKHFINSERYVTTPTKPVFLNYINFAKKLFDIKNSLKDKDFDFAKLKKEVLNERAMINKPWLLKKIEEIKITI